MCCSPWGRKGLDMTSRLNNSGPTQVQTQWPSRFLDMGLQGTLKELFQVRFLPSWDIIILNMAAKAPGKVKGKDDFKD